MFRLKQFIVTIALLMAIVQLQAQMGIGISTPHPSAGLEILNTQKGLLIPRVSLQSTGDNGTITGAATGLLVYNTNPSIVNGQGVGFYYNSSTNLATKTWVKWAQGSNLNQVWLTGGNSGTSSLSNFIGNTDNIPLFIKATNQYHGLINPNNRAVFFGRQSTSYNGSGGVGIGHLALYAALHGVGLVGIGDSVFRDLGFPNLTNIHGNTAVGKNASATSNNVINTTAFGTQALEQNSASGNTGIGSNALRTMNRIQNTAFGSSAMAFNNPRNPQLQTMDNNTAFGWGALFFLGDGRNNTAFGDSALVGISSRTNTAFGFKAFANGGNFNLDIDFPSEESVAIGNLALVANRRRGRNIAIGSNALLTLIEGENNIAIGYEALKASRANFNTAIGSGALANVNTGSSNIAIGAATAVATTSGSNNTAIGFLAMALGNQSNATAIGTNTFPSGSNAIRIGNTAIVSIGGQVDFTDISNGLIKTEVREDIPGMDFIRQLHPVTYHFNAALLQQYDPTLTPQMIAESSMFTERHAGLIAQDVLNSAKAYAKQGLTDIVHEPTTPDGLHSIQYGKLVVPLVKTVQEQQAVIRQIEKHIGELEKQIENL